MESLFGVIGLITTLPCKFSVFFLILKHDLSLRNFVIGVVGGLRFDPRGFIGPRADDFSPRLRAPTQHAVEPASRTQPSRRHCLNSTGEFIPPDLNVTGRGPIRSL